MTITLRADYAVVGYRNSAIATACIAAACHLLNLSIQPLLDMLASAGIVLAVRYMLLPPHTWVRSQTCSPRRPLTL